MAQQYHDAVKKVDTFLHQPGTINDYSSKIESLSGIKRIFVAQGLFALFVLYMIFGYFAALICNFVGFLYPAWCSIKALESHSKDDDTRWLTYWVVFAAFSVLEFFSDVIFSWFPLYWLAKVLFLVWCYLPGKQNGSDHIYKTVIRPIFLKNEKKFSTFISEAKDKVKDAVSSKDD